MADYPKDLTNVGMASHYDVLCPHCSVIHEFIPSPDDVYIDLDCDGCEEKFTLFVWKTYSYLTYKKPDTEGNK